MCDIVVALCKPKNALHACKSHFRKLSHIPSHALIKFKILLSCFKNNIYWFCFVFTFRSNLLLQASNMPTMSTCPNWSTTWKWLFTKKSLGLPALKILFPQDYPSAPCFSVILRDFHNFTNSQFHEFAISRIHNFTNFQKRLILWSSLTWLLHEKN